VSNPMKFGRAFLFAIGVLVSNAVSVPAQSADAERRFWPPSFRPATGKVSKKTVSPSYRPVSSALPKVAGTANDAVLGVTVWLLTDSPGDKDGARILRPKTGAQTRYTAKRVEATTKFTVGQKLRLSIEIPRNGYFYVIDREQYSDGSVSDPYLIFPVIPGEKNYAQKGRVFEVPRYGDEPCFIVEELGESGKPVVAEVLTLLVTTAPLKNLPKSDRKDGEYDIIPLDPAMVAKWEKDWGRNVEAGELEGGEGRLYTTREQQAGNRKSPLNRNDPAPQTVFRIAAKPGETLLVKIPLQIAAK
jgi:hypothetical protein